MRMGRVPDISVAPENKKGHPPAPPFRYAVPVYASVHLPPGRIPAGPGGKRLGSIEFGSEMPAPRPAGPSSSLRLDAGTFDNPSQLRNVAANAFGKNIRITGIRSET